MKTCIGVIVLTFTVSLAHGSESAITDAWSKENISPNARTALVERSKKAPFVQIAPVLLKALVGYQPFHAINPWGETPWNNDRLTVRDRMYLAARAVWQYHMTPRDELTKAEIILSLLQKTSGQTEQHILINAMMNDQWCPNAEAVLLRLAKNEQENLSVRRESVSTLLSRSDINIYLPLALEIVLSHKKGSDRCQAFNGTTNKGSRLFTLTEANRRHLLAVGFGIITELPSDDLQTGYFVARHLGFILRIQNEFSPSQEARQYHSEHGLTDEFFVNTVRNAITWYSKHKKEIVSN